MRKILLPMLMLSVMLITACGTTVRFPRGVRYNSPYVVDESAIVTFPDEVQERIIRLKLGGLIDSYTFKVPLLEAYTTETGARMKGLFNGSVTMSLNSVVEELLPAMQEASRAEEAEGEGDVSARELDALLDNIEGGDIEEEERSDDEWVADELYKASTEELIEENPAYWLRFEEALLGYPNNQAMVSFRVKLIDQRTGVVLLHKRYRGRSAVFEPYQSHKTNKDVLIRLTKQAFSGPMQQLVKDIAERTGGHR